MTEWPHEAIYIAATWYIRQHSMHESDWRYTNLKVAHEPLLLLVSLGPDEMPIVSCLIDADSWFVMTSRRIEISNKRQRDSVDPLEITSWDWGYFKTDWEPKIGTATLTKDDGTSVSFLYETGYASMAPIHYQMFWSLKYPVLDKLDLERLRAVNRVYEQAEDFQAEITILTPEEGGRFAPVFNGVRWDFQYEQDGDSQQHFMIWPEFVDEENEPISREFPLKGTYRARMYVVSENLRDLHRPRVQVGTEFFCVQGPKKVARGTVTKVTGLAD